MIDGKVVNLYVSSIQTPFELEIYASNGVLLERKIIRQNKSHLCLCLCLNTFYVVGRYNDQEIKRFYNISFYKCLNLFLSFNFNARQTAVKTIYLFDANYLLPIQSAILQFQQ